MPTSALNILTCTCACILCVCVCYFNYHFSPDMPENEATFAITPGGINDAKEWEKNNVKHKKWITHVQL